MDPTPPWVNRHVAVTAAWIVIATLANGRHWPVPAIAVLAALGASYIPYLVVALVMSGVGSLRDRRDDREERRLQAACGPGGQRR